GIVWLLGCYVIYKFQRFVVLSLVEGRSRLVELFQKLLRQAGLLGIVSCTYCYNRLGIVHRARFPIIRVVVSTTAAERVADAVGPPPRQANYGGFRVIVPKVIPPVPVPRSIAPVPAAVPGIVIVTPVLPVIAYFVAIVLPVLANLIDAVLPVVANLVPV